MLDDLFTYRLAECHFLTVTNAANHERDLAWFQRHADGFDVDVIDRRDDFAMLAVQGPAARGAARRPRRRRAAPADALLPARRGGRPDARVRHRLHRRGRRRAAARSRATRPPCGTRCSPPARRRSASARADTLRLEVCFHLYGNDLSERPRPDRGRPRLVLQGGDRLHRLRGDRRGSRRRAAPRSSSPFVIDGAGIARQGNPVAGGGVVTSGTFSPCLERGIGMAYVPAEQAEPGTELEIDVRGTARHGRRRAQAPLPTRRPDAWPTPAIPTTCSTTPSTTGRGSTASEATFGITWYAQDSLGEVVFFDPPKVGAPGDQGRALHRGRVRQGRLGRGRPLSGEVIAVNDALADTPETINEDPYGEGWLVKVKLSDPSEQEALMDAAAYEATLS